MGASVGDQLNFSNLAFIPNVAYAISPDALIGVNGTLSFISYDSETIDQSMLLESQSNYASIGLFYTQYKSIGEKWYFNVSFNAGVNWSENTTTSTDLVLNQVDSRRKNNSSGFSLGVVPGLSYKVSDWLLIEGNLGSLNFSKSNGKRTDSNIGDSEDSSKQLNTRISLGGLGVKFIL